MPLKQDLSLILELTYSQLDQEPASPSGPPVSTPLGAGVTGPWQTPGLLHGDGTELQYLMITQQAILTTETSLLPIPICSDL